MPTPIYRIVHIDNLGTLADRGGLHAPNSTPKDGLPYRAVHNTSVQGARSDCAVPCGPGGTVLDYVPFYFGTHSVMLLNLKTGRVPEYTEGQEPMVYLVTSVERIVAAASRFVFTDGHALAGYTRWFDDVNRLHEVDWEIVRERYWRNTDDDNDRQRRKQAEFLVQGAVDWDLIDEIGVFDLVRQTRVQSILSGNGLGTPAVVVRREWYYP